jgi:predicted RecA/RadA family phage recombinase
MGQYLQQAVDKDYTPSGEDVVSGDIRQHPSGLAGMVNCDTADGELGSLKVRGVVRHSKEPGLAMSAGIAAYWDESSGYFTDASTAGGYYAGVVDADAASGDDEVDVDLNVVLGP